VLLAENSCHQGHHCHHCRRRLCQQREAMIRTRGKYKGDDDASRFSKIKIMSTEIQLHFNSSFHVLSLM
jgi:hypothetical protein